MKNYNILFYVSILFLLILVLAGCQNNDVKNIQNNNYATKLSTNVNQELAENRVLNIAKSASIPEFISEYSTVIKDDSEGRLTNIRLTCDILNNTTIKNGETFSFNEIVGQPTSEKGYEEASIIIDGKTETGIGGGNCQVSSTIYNAVLNLTDLTVIERHEHGKPVAYVPEGQDAAVSYGSLDLKFRNDLGYDIILQVSTDDENITAKILRK